MGCSSWNRALALCTLAGAASCGGAPVDAINEGHALATATVDLREAARRPQSEPPRMALPHFRPPRRAERATIHAPAGEPVNPFGAPLLARSAVPLVSNFDGLDESGGHFAPADPAGAVGPNHLLVAVENRLQIQTKTGSGLVTLTFASFFQPVLGSNNVVTHPHVAYDPTGQRWIFIAESFTLNTNTASNGSILLAVSQTSNPTGSWNLFRVAVDANNSNLIGEAPTLGFNRSWIAVSTNVFDDSTFQLVSVRLFVFDKAAAYAGQGSGAHTTFSSAPITPSEDFGIAPAITLDATSNTLYLVEDFDGTSGTLRLFRLSGAAGSPVLTRLADVPVSGLPVWADSPLDASGTGDFIPQKGSSADINAGDSRFNQVVVRNGQLWAAHNVYLPCTSPDGAGGCGTSGPTHAAAQWLVIDPSKSSVLNAGRIEDSTASQTQGAHYFFPSIMPNKFGDALIGFSVSGVSQYASAGYSMRLGFDPANTMRDPSVYKSGLAPYDVTPDFGTNRWGTYSATAVDPSDDVTLWTLQEFAQQPASTSLFGTWWAKLTVDCTAKPDGFECDDGSIPDSCSTLSCRSGVCGAAPIACSPLDACHTAGTCSMGACSNPLKECPTNSNPCLTNVCSLSAGGCAAVSNDDGSACTPTNANLCFASFSCQAGTCTGQSAVVCNRPPDACHQATGSCAPSSGVCSYANKSDGTACPGGVCQAGSCSTPPDLAGASPVDGTSASRDASVPPDASATASDLATAPGDAATPYGDALATIADATAAQDLALTAADAMPGVDAITGAPVADLAVAAIPPGGASPGGCGCHVAGRSSLPSGSAMTALAALVLALARRRRRALAHRRVDARSAMRESFAASTRGRREHPLRGPSE